jgi:hypothetical protein
MAGLAAFAAERRAPVAALPMEPAAVSEAWVVNDETSTFALGVIRDDLLARPVLEVASRNLDTRAVRNKQHEYRLTSRATAKGAYVVEALLRFPDLPRLDERGRPVRARPRASLSVGLLTNDLPAFVLEGGTGVSPLFIWSVKRGDDPPKAKPVSGSLKANVTPDISPLSPEAFRLESEAELARMPRPENCWIPVRIEVGASHLRFYFNGCLALERLREAGTDGPVTLTLRDRVRIASLEVRPLPGDNAPFVTVPLDSRCNAAATLASDALAAVRQTGAVHGVPFVFPATVPFDHVDVGQSLYRYRMGTSYTADYDPRITAPSPAEFEPGRILLTVPKRAYRRAWLLAGADGREHHVPLVTLRFYKPFTGWSTDTAVTVPAFASRDGGTAKPVAVRDAAGQAVNLWLVPVDLDAAALAADFTGDVMHIELTKAVKPNLAYPDPANYGYQAGGLPSSVRIYGLTLEEAPVQAVASGDLFGNTYTDPEQLVWQVTVQNRTADTLPVEITVAATDPYGLAAAPTVKRLALKPGETQVPAFPLKPAVLGLHAVRTTVKAGDWSQSREGYFLRLPAFARRETGVTSPWGVWNWGGTHATHGDLDDNGRLLKAVGAINNHDLTASPARGQPAVNLNEFRKKWGLGATHDRIIPRDPPLWAAKDPVDPAEREAYKEVIGKRARQLKDDHPDFQYVNCFAENSVSLRLTHGVRASAFGLPEYEFNEKELARLRHLLTAALAGAEGVRQYAPEVKFIFGHGAANFAWPFFTQPDWNFDLFAGIGLDLPQFERMPERQPRATEPSLLYFLREELKARGQIDKELVHLESYFPGSHELALGLRGQADSIVRTAVLSLALGTTKFMHTWSLQDCADRWGSQHYGGCGLYARIPESNPKPAAAAFATMTRVLDRARFDGWIDTGSLSTFCIRFKGEDRLVYAVWTIRGTRPLEVVVNAGSAGIERIDDNGNTFPVAVAGGKAVVPLAPTPCWIVVRGGALASAAAGEPVHAEAPGERVVMLDDFETRDWQYAPGAYDRYGSNSWDMAREPTVLEQSRVRSEVRGSTVWRVSARALKLDRPCAGQYGVFTPPRPIPIPGQARAIGIRGNGRSQWFRLVYELQDARGETWISCGPKDAWNSDDIHSRSFINHDGWRYMEFPLPASAPGDNYREIGCYSWGGSDDGIVDLPLKLTRIIVEMRSHVVYANEMLPVPPEDWTLELDDLVAVYERPEDQTDAPVKLQATTKDVWRPRRVDLDLPNPIERLREAGVGNAAVIEKIYPPEVMAGGDQVYVRIHPVADAQKYTVYVSAYENGTGAQVTGQMQSKDEPSTIWVRKLQPAIPMYFFATYTDKDGKESKPSVVRKTILRDEFPFK